MLCPRCGTDLQTSQARPRPDAPALSVDTCGRCAGLWLDGGELAPALAALGGLPSRLGEIAQTAVPASFACQYDRQSSMLRKLLTAGKYEGTWGREAMIKLAREIGSDDYWGWELNAVPPP